MHPSKRPASWKTPPKKNARARGKERSRTERDDRSQTRSGDRRGEKPKDSSRRQQSPHQSRDRIERVQRKERRNVSEDDSDQDQKELERLVEKSEKLQERIDRKKGSTTRRIISEIFGKNDQLYQKFLVKMINYIRNLH